MPISLKKGHGVSLQKKDYDLSLVTIGLGWDCIEDSSQSAEWDLDVIAFLCDSNRKVKDLGTVQGGKPTLLNGDVVFFNSLKHKSGQIWLTGDNRTGEGDGDDEQIIVKLDTIPEQYHLIAFIVQIYQGIKNGQDFSGVNNAFIRAVDKTGREMARFELSGSQFTKSCSMIFAELTRENNAWKFSAVGEPFASDSFVHILKERYL
ncbi:tellurium resistance protein TerX [Achromatium sp. WMS2]|nr:tellurium resistance protein TerX [Achromatium sp. WMS2]